MQDMLLQNYEWLRAIHLIAVISWMAGLLYLPRLFVYHAEGLLESPVPKATIEKFKIMERRLYKFIMVPAMIVTWILGLGMLYANPGMMEGAGWMHAKLLLVFLMTGVHHIMLANMKRFANDANTKSPKYFRIFNEVPTVLMVIIVILAVVQPF